jgi:hypothetical protein
VVAPEAWVAAAWAVVNNNNKPLSNKDMLLNRNKDMHLNRNKDMHLKKVTVQELEPWLLVLVAHTPTIKPNKKKLTTPFKLNRTPSGNNACLSTQNSYLA